MEIPDNSYSPSFPPELICPAVTTDVVAFMLQNREESNYRKNAAGELNVLLVRRGIEPYKGMWALPGGFLRANETVEECAQREIMEETNIAPKALVPIGVYSRIDRDPRGRVVSNAYMAVISEEPGRQIGGFDAEDAQWFGITLERKEGGAAELLLRHDDIAISAELRIAQERFGTTVFETTGNNGLAFDHAEIIAAAMETLRKSAATPELMFELLPERFTLSALQQVHETITKISDGAANFRRKIAEYVTETDEYTVGSGHRPARLYTRRK